MCVREVVLVGAVAEKEGGWCLQRVESMRARDVKSIIINVTQGMGASCGMLAGETVEFRPV